MGLLVQSLLNSDQAVLSNQQDGQCTLRNETIKIAKSSSRRESFAKEKKGDQLARNDRLKEQNKMFEDATP